MPGSGRRAESVPFNFGYAPSSASAARFRYFKGSRPKKNRRPSGRAALPGQDSRAAPASHSAPGSSVEWNAGFANR